MYIISSFSLYKSKFEECTAGYWGGGAYLERFYSPTSENKECVSGCSFTKCNATTQNDGGMGIYSPPTEFKMQNTIFISCYLENLDCCKGKSIFRFI